MLSVQQQHSLIRRLDPRSRFIVPLTILTLAFIVNTIDELIVLSIVTIAVTFIFNVWRDVLGKLKKFVPVLALAFVLWTTLHSYSLFYYRGTSAFSMEIGAFMTVRLFIIITASLILVNIVTPNEIIGILRKLGVPSNIAFTFGLALRHIKSISHEYLSIKEQQMSRGLELDKGFLVSRIKNYIPVLTPLIIRSIELADNITLAMKLKLYSGSSKRLYLLNFKMKNIDYIVSLVCISAIIFTIILKFLLNFKLLII